MSISSTDANLIAGDWAHVSFTYNKFTSNVNLFVNNVLVGSANDVFIDLSKTDTDFAIGYDMDNATNTSTHFKGAVDDIQIYNRELSVGEIAFLSDTTNTDLFLKNQLVGHWSFEQFTNMTNSFLDTSTFENTSTVSTGTVSYGSQHVKGNTSIVFDGSASMTAPNEGFNTNYMSASAWVKPTETNTTFVEKDGVFSFGLNNNGLPDLKIGDSDTTNLKFLKNLNNSSLKSHLTFEDTVRDSVGYTQAVATNATFQTDSYNPSVGGSSMVLDGVESYVNTGKILENINDPNQMTMGMWVNMQELEDGKSYPLVSVNNGFEWWINKDGDFAQMNYYQPGVVDFSIGTFSVTDNVGTGEIVITTDTEKTYAVALFTGELDMTNAEDVNKFKTVSVIVAGTITADTGVEQTISFTINTIHNNDDLTTNTLDKANNGYLYVSVAGGELNESRVLVNTNFKAYATDQYDMHPDNLTLTQVSMSGGESSFLTLSESYFASGDRQTDTIRIYKTEDGSLSYTIPSADVWTPGSLAMTDYYMIVSHSTSYKLYYRTTSEQWVLFYTSPAVGGASEYNADMYGNVGVIQGGNNLYVNTITAGETQDDVPTVSVKVITGTQTYSFMRVCVYQNTIVYANNNTNEVFIRELNNDTQEWDIVKTYTSKYNYGIDVYENTLVCKDNTNRTLMYIFKKVNGTWNDNPSETITLPNAAFGVTGVDIFENYILVGTTNASGNSLLFTRDVNGVWDTTGKEISYGGNQAWSVGIVKDTLVLGRASTAYMYKGVTSPADLTPVITLDILYKPFENDIQVSGTIFSSHTSFTKIYNPLVFANDVDASILTDEYLKAYVVNPDNNVGSTDVDYKKDLVNAFEGYTVNKAINANGDLIDLDENYTGGYKIFLLFEDTVGEIFIETYVGLVATPPLPDAGDISLISPQSAGLTTTVVTGRNIVEASIPNLPKLYDGATHTSNAFFLNPINPDSEIIYEFPNHRLVTGFKVQDSRTDWSFTYFDVYSSISTNEDMKYIATYTFPQTASSAEGNPASLTITFPTSIVSKYISFKNFIFIRLTGTVEPYCAISEIYIYGSSSPYTGNVYQSLPSISTLRSPITSSQVTTDGIALDGTITPDTNNLLTTYYALATTNPNLTNEEVMGMMKDPAYAEAVITEEVPLGLGNTIELTLDNGSKQSYAITTDSVTDADDSKTPWILVLNYMHKGGTSHDITVKDETTGFPVLPLDASMNYENVSIYPGSTEILDGSLYQETWGHTSLSLFDRLCDALGNTGLEVRINAKTNNHERKINFKTDDPLMVNNLRLGNVGATWTNTFTFIPYVDHTSIIPLVSGGLFSYGGGEDTMPNGLFANQVNQNNRYWRINSTSYMVDDVGGVSATTYHQIWVRANKSESMYNLSLPKLLLPNIIDTSNTIGPASATSYANVYLYATDGNPEHDDIDKFTITPEVPGMYITAKAEYARFDEKLHVRGTAFTNDTKNVVKVYFAPFSMDVDLSDEATVKTFLETYGTSQDITVTPYNVGQTNSFVFDEAFTDISDNSLKTTILADEPYEVRMMAVDVDGGYVIGEPDIGVGFVSVRNVDWSQIVDETPDFDILTSGVNGLKCSLSSDGKIALLSGGNGAWVYYFNDTSNKWGKYNVDGTFVSLDTSGFTPHSLLVDSGTNGTYGSACALSGDGMTVVISCYNTISNGGGWVWQYNAETYTWGKYVTNGIFIPGEDVSGFKPHDLSKLSGTNGYYGTACSISGNGKTVIITGSSSDGVGGAWVWHYNENMYTWGKYDTDGSFIPGDTVDFTPHDLSMLQNANGFYGRSCCISHDGYSVVVGGQSSGTKGGTWVWQYNGKTYTWGKYDTDGSFIPGDTVDFTPHDLSMTTSTKGNYGYSTSISADGKTVIISGEAPGATIGGCAWVWNFDENTHTWGKYDTDGSFIPGTTVAFTPHDLSNSTATNYGHFCSISGDGRTLIISAHFSASGGGSWIYQYNSSVHTWGKFTDNIGTFVPHGTHDLSIASAGGLYGQSCAISTDGLSVLVSGSTCAYVWNGVDNGELYQIPFHTDKGGMSFPTSIKTTITSTKQTDEGIVFSGEVIPDSTNETSYYAVATTTDDLTIEQIRDIANNVNYDYSSALTPVVVPTTLTLTDQLVHYVLDTTTVEPYATVSSIATGYAKVYLYATDGIEIHDDIDYKTLDLIQDQVDNMSTKSLFVSSNITRIIGTTNPLEIPNSVVNRPVFSFSCWVNIYDDLSSNEGYLFSLNNASNTNQHRRISIHSTGISIRSGVIHNVPYTFIKNTWYHICAVFANESTRLDAQKIYINGVYHSSTETATTIASITVTNLQELYILSNFDGTNELKGVFLDNLKVFDTSLTSSEVLELYSTDSVTGSTPIIHYTFDADTIVSENEISNNGDVKYNLRSPTTIETVEYENRGLVLVSYPLIALSDYILTTRDNMQISVSNSRPMVTFSFWLKITIPIADLLTNIHTIISLHGSSSTLRTVNIRAKDGLFAFHVNGAQYRKYDLQQDTWYHVCVIFEDNSSIGVAQRIYVDGNLNTHEGGSIGTFSSPTQKLNIGGGEGYLIDTFMVFDSVLGDSDIALLALHKQPSVEYILHQTFDNIVEGVFPDKHFPDKINTNYDLLRNSNKLIFVNNSIPTQPSIDYNPRVTIPVAIYSPFHDTVLVSGAAFSSTDNLTTVYPPVAFTSDVDLSDEEALKTFFSTYVTPRNVSSYTLNHVEQFKDVLITETYTDLSGATTPIVEGEAYNIRMYALTDDADRWAIGAPISIGAMDTYDRLFHMDMRDTDSYDGTVSTINDISPAGRTIDWQGTKEVVQLNGHNFIAFQDTSTSYLQANDIPYNNYNLTSILVVNIPNSSPSAEHIFTHGQRDTGGNTIRTMSDKFFFNNSLSVISGSYPNWLESDVTSSELHNKNLIIVAKQFYESDTNSYVSLRICEVDTTNVYHVENSNIPRSSTLVVKVSDHIRLGTALNAATAPCDARIGELLIYAGMLNETEELAEVERLRNKWRVGGSAESAGVSYLSTLRTSLTSVTSLPNEEITFTGSVIADTTNETTYFALATTVKNLTDVEVRDMMFNPDYAEGVKTVVVSSGTTLVLTNEPLPNVIDTSTSAPYTIHSSKSVNTAHVYLYAKDNYAGVQAHDDIDYIELTTTEVGPRVYIPTVVYRPFENDVTVSGTTFSYNSSVSTIHIGVFDPYVDLSGHTETQIMDYIVANSTGTPLVVNQNIVGSFTDIEISSVFTDLVGGTNLLVDGMKYDVRVVAVDALSDKGMNIYVNTSGYFLSVRDVDWSGVVASTPTYTNLDKLITGIGSYGEFCGLSGDGTVAVITGSDGPTRGCGYVWRLIDGTWVADDATDATNTLDSSRLPTPYNTDTLGYYGRKCVISANGNVILITGTVSQQGCGYVWRYNETTFKWDPDSTNLNSTHISESINCEYGVDCAISSDGNTALICGHNNTTYDGCAYIWRYIDGVWVHGPINLIDGVMSKLSGMGQSCALSPDGKIAMVAGSVGTSTEGFGYIWRYINNTWVRDQSNLNSSNIVAGVSGFYGYTCSLSADGNIAAIGGYKTGGTAGGCAYIWRYVGDTWTYDSSKDNLSKYSGNSSCYPICLSADGLIVAMGGYKNARLLYFSGTTWVEKNIYKTRVDRTESVSISGDGKHVLCTSSSSTNGGYGHIYEGVVDANQEPIKILLSSIEMNTASTLRTTIETAELTDTITFSGEVIPDSTNATTYYAMATTNPALTNDEVRTMMTNTDYATAIVSASSLTALLTLNDELLANVVDASGTVVSAIAVNTANVYLYATDGVNVEHDDIDLHVIDPIDLSNKPHVHVSETTSPTSPTSGIIVNNGTVYSGIADIQKYYTVAFVTSADDAGDVVDPADLTLDNIAAFVTGYLGSMVDGYNGDLYSSGVSNTVYYKGDTPPAVTQYTVESLSNITLNGAFRTLNPTGIAGDIATITDASGWTFSPYIIAVDTAARYGLGAVLKPGHKYWRLDYDLAKASSPHYHHWPSELGIYDTHAFNGEVGGSDVTSIHPTIHESVDMKVYFGATTTVYDNNVFGQSTGTEVNTINSHLYHNTDYSKDGYTYGGPGQYWRNEISFTENRDIKQILYATNNIYGKYNKLKIYHSDDGIIWSQLGDEINVSTLTTSTTKGYAHSLQYDNDLQAWSYIDEYKVTTDI
jgi:hypothetical protein